jgi:D-galactarolactone cycloisomerase
VDTTRRLEVKIREIRSAGLRGDTPLGWAEKQDCVQTILAVLTDEGPVGWGSVYTNDELVAGALTVMRPFYEGLNALEPERSNEILHQNTFWMGRGGAITHTISGIDIALWDLLGQATGQPVGRLLGGRYRERVMPYASLLMEDPGVMADRLIPLKERGFRAFKIGWGPFGRRNNATDEAIVRVAREAIGPDCRLMIDAGASDAFWPQGYKWALNTSHMLANYDVAWFEEALVPDALEDFVALRRQSPVPITGGEVLTRRQSFRPWLQAGAWDIVQPDATKVGGLSESRRIAWMAHENGVRVIPHGWNSALGLAADLQFASAFADVDLIEYLTGSPFIDKIAAGGWKLNDDGTLPIPDRPGLGVTVDLDAVEKYTGVKNFIG